MKTPPASVDAYLAALSEERREALQTLRAMIFRINPRAEESIMYGMPSYSGLCSIASQKNHISLYVGAEDLLEKHRDRIGKVDCGKYCIRFKNLAQLNLAAVESMLREIHQSSIE